MNKITIGLMSLICFVLVCSCNMREGGVRVMNNMEEYAIKYMNTNQLLNTEEKVLAYYDYTISLDGTEAAILTDSRLIYHNKETTTSFIAIKDITDIQHRKETLIGDIIEVTDHNGDLFVVEIAPLNQGETFLRVLQSKVNAIE
ncbi:hypothetical protein GCM10022393_40500 [Aquimarina addita]|uniref:YokE-like PH domain-containing protein n=1 Tax=Aquimarina addita TaxID=870485 RepID=A0ABP6UTG3_9FLAO